MLVAADLQRPAAIEQLRTPGRPGRRPGSRRSPAATRDVGRRTAVAEARASGRDVVIVDTAGRLAIDAEMMQQVKDISAWSSRTTRSSSSTP